jgi:uncharacterized membrane protein
VSSRDARTGLAFLLSLAGAAVAAYLALFEVGLVTIVWDPLFAGGSEQVIRWSATVALPVPDALLGFLAYGTEAVLLVGARLADRPVSRWLTVALGVVATLMALTSVGLVLAQAFLVRAWCTLCLVSAVLSWTIALIAIPEAITEFRALRAGRRASNATARGAVHE